MSRRIRTCALFLALASAGMLGGCGVKGPLEPPSAASTPANGSAAQAGGAPAAAAPQASATPAPAASGGAPASAPAAPQAAWQKPKSTYSGSASAAPVNLDAIKRPDTPFILDGLL